MIIDDYNIVGLGAIVQDRLGSRSRTDIRHAFKGSPGAWKTVYVGQQPVAPKLLTCNGFIEATSLANLKSAMDELEWRCSPDVGHTVAWSDITDREWVYARSSGVSFRGFKPEWVQPYVQFTVSFLCADPRARDTSETSTETSGSLPRAREINLGTAPHPFIITITGDSGNLTNPTVSYRNYNDDVIASFTITDVLDQTETVRINTDTGVVEKDSGGGYVNAGSTFSGTLVEAYPSDGRVLGGAYPPTTVDLFLEGGTGESCDLFKVQYYKRWW
jgi:hypothetical protein